MKNLSSIIMASLLLCGGLSSCSDDEGTRPGPSDGIVKFNTSTVTEMPGTRVANDVFEAGDAIGVYMVQGSGTTVLAENKRYTTVGGSTATFSPGNLAADGIKMPESGNVDFYTYYPYAAASADMKVAVDVTNQNAEIDLLYSTVKNVDNGQTNVPLTFDHQLSKHTFVIKNEAGVSLAGLKVTLKGLKTKGTFDLADASFDSDNSSVADISAVTASDGLSATALVIPAGSVDGFTVNFKTSDFDQDYEFANGKELKGGVNEKHTVTFTADGQVLISGTINGWDDQDGEDIEINVGDGGGGEGGVIFKETFGDGTYGSGNRPKIADFTDFDEKGVTYSDASGRTDIRTVSGISAHAWFPSTGDAYLTISGINTSGYSDIKLSFDVAANLYSDGDMIDLNVMAVSFDGTNYSIPSTPVSKANGDDGKFYTFEFEGLNAVSNGVLEFYTTNTTNTLGLRLDNITITAGDGGTDPGPGPQPGGYYPNGVLADFDFQLGSAAISNLGVALPLTQTGTSALIGTASLTVVGFPEAAVSWTGSSVSLWRGNWEENTTEKYWLTTYPLNNKIAAGKKIEIGYKAWGTATAPKEFAVEISTDNNSWSNIDSYELTATASTAYSFSYTVPADIESSAMYIRIRPTSTMTIGGGSMNANGNVRLSQMKVDLAD